MAEKEKIVVEKNVPIPGVMESTFPFAQMEVGDSFVTKDTRLRQYAAHYAKKHKKKFTIRTAEDGMRCWRIA